MEQIRFELKGEKFVAIRKDGKINVRKQRSAPGNYVVAGVYDPKEEIWQNGKCALSREIKESIIMHLRPLIA